MAVKYVGKYAKNPTPVQDDPPWAEPSADALTELRKFKPDGQGLTLLSRKDGSQFQVLAFVPETGEIRLRPSKGKDFTVVFRERENRYYEPVWR